jgi:hypothetical protein
MDASHTSRRRAIAIGRRGLALPTALMLLVVLSTLAAGAFTASRQSYRGGRNTLIEQRAMSVAEFGLNQQVANWRTELNLPAPRGLAVGRVDASNVWITDVDTARVRITRLTNMLYHVESVGRASIPNPQLTATRSVGAILRLAYPSIEPRGAVTAGGRVELQGSAVVDGRDYVPYSWSNQGGWPDSVCAGMRGSLMPAIAVPPGTAQSDSSPLNIPVGRPPRHLRPGRPATRTRTVRFGTESWNTLAASANIRYTGGSGPQGRCPDRQRRSVPVRPARELGAAVPREWRRRVVRQLLPHRVRGREPRPAAHGARAGNPAVNGNLRIPRYVSTGRG